MRHFKIKRGGGEEVKEKRRGWRGVWGWGIGFLDGLGFFGENGPWEKKLKKK